MALKKIIAGLIVAAGFGYSSAATAVAEEHNDGKAEAVGKTIGGTVGAAAGTLAGNAAAGAAGAAGGAVMGQSVGEGVGTASGRYLDNRADENRQTGRGGADDARYDPSSLFDN